MGRMGHGDESARLYSFCSSLNKKLSKTSVWCIYSRVTVLYDGPGGCAMYVTVRYDGRRYVM